MDSIKYKIKAMNSNKTYTRAEVAKIFKVTTDTIDNWRDKGVIKAIKVGERAIRFTDEEVARLMNGKRDGSYY